jgi:hypothetical protein
MYKNRMPITKSAFRMSEVYRFAFQCDFDERLYSHLFRRYYDFLRIRHGLLPTIKNRKIKELMSEESLPKLIMTYDSRDMKTSVITDIDLFPDSYTFMTLPKRVVRDSSEYRYRPYSKAFTFTELALSAIETDIQKNQQKFKASLEKYGLDRDDKLKKEIVPPLETVAKYEPRDEDRKKTTNKVKSESRSPKQSSSKAKVTSVPSSKSSSSVRRSSSYENPSSSSSEDNNDDSDDDTYTRKLKFQQREKKKDKSERVRSAEKSSVIGDIISTLDFDTRTSILAEIEKRGENCEETDENRFADKTILKKPPTPDILFSGKVTQAAQFINFIMVNIAKYNFTVSESFSMIESSMKDDALRWFLNQRSEIFAQPIQKRLKSFVELYKQQYMSESMATWYETQLNKHYLKGDSILQVEAHYHKFVELMTNWRACNPTVNDNTLVHRYYSVLPEITQRTLGVKSVSECKTVSDMYRQVKAASLLINKDVPSRFEV